jgi:hypothetical protein
MDKTNRLLTLRINYLRRQVNLKNFIILLITVYVIYKFFTSPTDNSAKSADMQSCYSACQEVYQKCSLHCSNQLDDCRQKHSDQYVEQGDKCSSYVGLTCHKPCSNNYSLCSKNCMSKYNFHSSLRLAPGGGCSGFFL